MFSKSNKEQIKAVTATQGKNPRMGRSSVPSIISADLSVKGMLVSTGDVQIDGHVEGDVRAVSLVIGDKAAIEGDICAEEVIIRGRVRGAIRARKVMLCSTCHVEGNILHEALAMEAGAYFEGNCRHSDKPLAESNNEAVQLRRPAPSAQLVAPPRPQAIPPAMHATAAPLRPTHGLDDRPPIVAPRPAAAEYNPLKA